MRPVDLRPEHERSQAAPKALEGGAFVAIGVLATLLVAFALYVTTSNRIAKDTAAIKGARAEIEQARARAATLTPFERFSQINESRLAAVRSLAQSRFDWERLMREIALVLPSGSWLSEVTASVDGSAATAAASTGSTPPSGAAAAPTTGGSPSVKLVGCATSQANVAVLLVRLRQLRRATDVQLTGSTREDDGLSAGSASAGSATTSSEGCGSGRYKFDATVTLSAPAPDEEQGVEPVPSRLGGGA